MVARCSASIGWALSPPIALLLLEDGQRNHPQMDGDLTVTKTTAADAAKTLAEDCASPLTFEADVSPLTANWDHTFLIDD